MSGKHLLLIPFLLCLFTAEAAGIEVPLTRQAGVYTVSARINGIITLNFIVDSGASEVTVPAGIALTLLRSGAISEKDFLPGQKYRLADGSILKGSRFNIRELDIGGLKMSNVPVSVVSATGPTLLGQSFLSRAGNWTIDNERKILVISGSTKAEAPKPETKNANNQPSSLQDILNDGQATSFRKIPPSKEVGKTLDGKIAPTRQ